MLIAAAALHLRTTRDHGPIVIGLFALAVLALAGGCGRWALAVYALAFWHYAVYALAFFWRRIPHEGFLRDAMLLKGLSLAGLAYALAVALPGPLPLAIMTAGFALNIAAARALGMDRTHYGQEVAGLPPLRCSAFPFSHIAHPMLLGNMAAYGGLLLDPGFRQQWAPLAMAHLALNGLILLMELRGRASRLRGLLWQFTGFALGSALLLAGFSEVREFAIAAVAAGAVFGAALLRRYSGAAGQRKTEEKPR